MRYTPTSLLCLVLAAAILAGCGDNKPKASEGELAVDSNATANVEKLVYGLPSPSQALSLLKAAGARYEEKLLNSDANVSKYQSAPKAALNIGVYGSAMAYTSTFGRNQDAIKYFVAVQKLADQLGIGGAFDERMLRRAEKNRNNQDSLIAIISHAFTKANVTLKKNNQEELAKLLIIGGYIEGLYIGCEIYKLNPKPEIGKRLAEQKATLENLMAMLDDSKDKENVKGIYAQLQQLQAAYAPITIEYSGPATETKKDAAAKKSKSSTIRINNKSDIKFTKEQLLEVQKQVAIIRASIIA